MRQYFLQERVLTWHTARPCSTTTAASSHAPAAYASIQPPQLLAPRVAATSVAPAATSAGQQDDKVVAPSMQQINEHMAALQLREGDAALHAAARAGHAHLIPLLLMSGASPELRNQVGLMSDV